jgi:hypothetical protein
MTRIPSEAKRPAGWRPDLKVPQGTLWLPIASTRPLEELGNEVAVKILGPGTSRDQLKRFAETVTDGTADSRRRGAKKGGLIFHPDYNRLPPIANIDVFGYHSGEPGQPSSLEFYRDAYGTPGKRTVGDIAITEATLPAGPALRFHRRYVPEAGWQPVVYEREAVTYAIRPPQIDDALVLTVSWVEFQFSEALIKSADAIAQTLEVKLLDP